MHCDIIVDYDVKVHYYITIDYDKYYTNEEKNWWSHEPQCKKKLGEEENCAYVPSFFIFIFVFLFLEKKTNWIFLK